MNEVKKKVTIEIWNFAVPSPSEASICCLKHHDGDPSMTGSWWPQDTFVRAMSVSLEGSFLCWEYLMKCLSTSNFTSPVGQISAQVTSTHPQKPLSEPQGPLPTSVGKVKAAKRSKLTKYSGEHGLGSPLWKKGSQESRAKAWQKAVFL